MNKDLREKIEDVITTGTFRSDMTVVDQLLALITEEQKSLLEKIKLEKKYKESISLICPKCRQYGVSKEAKYCQYDRTKLIEEVFKFDDYQQQGYNQAVDDLDQLKAHLTTGGGEL